MSMLERDYMQDLTQVFKTLLEAYGPRHWWPAESPYEMMVGAILTQNTTWLNVEKAIAELGPRLTPEYIAAVPEEELAALIRSSGYYNQKAKKLKVLTAWFAKYNYNIEAARRQEGQALRRELLEVKGVGPETADSILTYALEKPFFVVDSYTRRLFSRLGYELEPDYEGLRRQIEDSLPKDLYIYNEFHALIVEHAKRHCRKKPACEGCPLVGNCSQKI